VLLDCTTLFHKNAAEKYLQRILNKNVFVKSLDVEVKNVWLKSPQIIINAFACCVCSLVAVELMMSYAASLVH